MTKATFLDALRQALSGLPQTEIDEAVAYYAGYIDDAGEENQQDVLAELGDPAEIAAQIRGDQLAKPAPALADTDIPLGARIPLAVLHVLIGIPVLGSLILTTACLVLSGAIMLLAGVICIIVLLLFGLAEHAPTAVMWLGLSIITAALGVILGVASIYATKWLCQLLADSTKYLFGGEKPCKTK